MVKRSFPIVATVALAILLMSAGTSRAQMGGFWGGWGTASPWSGTGGWTYWPGGIGINYQPGIYSGGYGFGGMGGIGMYPGNAFGFNGNAFGRPPVNIVGYYPPIFTTHAPLVAPPRAVAENMLPANQPGTVEVIAPADAIITFDGHRTTQTGTHRLFTTPALVPGESYHYTVQAVFTKEGKPVTQKQRVAVYAGGRSTAVFPMSP